MKKITVKIHDGVPEVDCQSLYSLLPQIKNDVYLIDVRRPEEFSGELGHIEGAQLITLGPDLAEWLDQADKNSEIVFICRSGGRSATATLESLRRGFSHTVNLTGGMLAWNSQRLPLAK